MRFLLIAAAMFIALLTVAPAHGQSLVFEVFDSGNITGYESGSKRAPIAARQVTNNNAEAVELIELVFSSSLPLDPQTVGSAMAHYNNDLRGQIVSTGSFVDAAGLHVLFGRGFGRNQTGLSFPAGIWQQEIVIFADLPPNLTGDLKLSLVSYQTKYSRRRELPLTRAVVENGYTYHLVPAGSVGFQPVPPIKITLTNQAPPVHLFWLTSITASGFAFYGPPTWYGSGIGTGLSSGGMLPGSFREIKIGTDMPADAHGPFYGTQLIGNGQTGICITVPVTVIVQ